MTRYLDSKRGGTPADVPIVASYNNAEHKDYICSECSRTMIRLWDSTHQSPSYFCRACNIETRTDEMNSLRSKSRLEVPSGVNSTPLTSNKFTDYSVGRSPPPVRGSFKTLQEKGMRIKNYSEKGFKDNQ